MKNLFAAITAALMMLTASALLAWGLATASVWAWRVDARHASPAIAALAYLVVPVGFVGSVIAVVFGIGISVAAFLIVSEGK